MVGFLHCTEPHIVLATRFVDLKEKQFVLVQYKGNSCRPFKFVQTDEGMMENGFLAGESTLKAGGQKCYFSAVHHD